MKMKSDGDLWGAQWAVSKRLPSQLSSRNCTSKNSRPSGFASWTNLCLLLITISSCLFSQAAALQVVEMPPIQTALALASFANPGILLVDPRPRPALLNRRNGDHYRREEEEKPKTTTTTDDEKSKTTATTLITTTAASTTESSSTSTTSTPTSTGAYTLPSPFDTSLGNNFTNANCPAFIDEFISTDTFKSCYPFSLLLQTSTSFFDAQKSALHLTETVQQACSANVTFCTDYLYGIANNLTTEANCKDDFELENPDVVEAYNGLVSYRTLYSASCIVNPKTNSYCVVDAFTNTSSPTDSYIYYIPLGTSLPGGTTPTCDSCLGDTMTLFQKAAANTTQPIAQTYATAAEQVDLLCGPTFANVSIPMLATSGARSLGMESGEGVGALILAIAAALWLL